MKPNEAWWHDCNVTHSQHPRRQANIIKKGLLMNFKYIQTPPNKKKTGGCTEISICNFWCRDCFGSELNKVFFWERDCSIHEVPCAWITERQRRRRRAHVIRGAVPCYTLVHDLPQLLLLVSLLYTAPEIEFLLFRSAGHCRTHKAGRCFRNESGVADSSATELIQAMPHYLNVAHYVAWPISVLQTPL